MRLAALLSLLASLAVLTAGCSASIDDVAQAATKTSAAPTARFAITISHAVPGAQPIVITGTGAFDSARRLLGMSIDLSRVPGSPGSIDLVLAGQVMYARLPSLAPRLPGGVHWVSVDVGRLAAEAGLDLGALTSYGGTDPRDSLGAIAAASDLRRVGNEAVRGVATTRFRGSLDIRKALDAVAGAHGELGRLAEAALRRAGVDSIPTEVWVDRQGWVRRIRQTVAATVAGISVPTSTEVDFFAFGRAVRVALPARTDTVDVGALGR